MKTYGLKSNSSVSIPNLAIKIDAVDSDVCETGIIVSGVIELVNSSSTEIKLTSITEEFSGECVFHTTSCT